jgi:hypothetical protein
MSNIGWRTVVSAGDRYRAKVSSKLMTDSWAGTWMPAAYRACMAPAATRSETAKTAVRSGAWASSRRM